MGAKGFNIVQELIFSDGVTWLARVPIPFNCFQPDECTLSYGAILRYLRKNSRIPVPEVYDYAIRSDPKNPTNTSYVLMERMTGQALPTLDEDGYYSDPKALSLGKKVHEQLTGQTKNSSFSINDFGNYLGHSKDWIVLEKLECRLSSYLNLSVACPFL